MEAQCLNYFNPSIETLLFRYFVLLLLSLLLYTSLTILNSKTPQRSNMLNF